VLFRSRREGRAEGKAEGYDLAKREDQELALNEKRQIARNLKKQGVSPEIISAAVPGLSLKEIEEV
jgi:predicted transposase YdaD